MPPKVFRILALAFGLTLAFAAEPITVERARFLAVRGDRRAQALLGKMYDDGEMLPKNDELSAKWFQKSAAQGYPKAMVYLGLDYQSGQGVKKDVFKAMALFRQAAAKGDDEACMVLGMAYWRGQEGVTQSYTEAFRWYQKSAKRGDRLSMRLLADMYWLGEGVERSALNAYLWQRLAVEDRVDNAPEDMQNFKKELSPEDVVRAEARIQTYSDSIAEYQSKHPL